MNQSALRGLGPSLIRMKVRMVSRHVARRAAIAGSLPGGCSRSSADRVHPGRPAAELTDAHEGRSRLRGRGGARDRRPLPDAVARRARPGPRAHGEHRARRCGARSVRGERGAPRRCPRAGGDRARLRHRAAGHSPGADLRRKGSPAGPADSCGEWSYLGPWQKEVSSGRELIGQRCYPESPLRRIGSLMGCELY